MLLEQIPRKSLAQAYALAPDFGKLATAAAYSPGWLLTTLQDAALADDGFTGNLVRIAKAIMAQHRRNPVTLGVLRSDYMLDEPRAVATGDLTPKLLQVELNTIASSFASLSSCTT